MIEIIEPEQFKTIPWKNGLGETTELAINEQANLDDFSWRLSIASVVNDGVFSDFSGYHRHLVLIKGKGLSLQHDDKNVDMLDKLLDVARFDGGCETLGKLADGAIKDFNIITANNKVSAQVDCYIESQQVTIKRQKSHLYFAYSLSDTMQITASKTENSTVPAGYLAKLSIAAVNELTAQQQNITITGENMIIVQLAL